MANFPIELFVVAPLAFTLTPLAFKLAPLVFKFAVLMFAPFAFQLALCA
jgi:hypothetical protein